MSQELHPFWKGVQDEFQKQGFFDAAVGALGSVAPWLATPVGAATALGLGGIGAIALGRKLRLPLFHKAKPAAEAAGEVAKKGFGWKGMAAAAGAGALGGAYLARRKREE